MTIQVKQKKLITLIVAIVFAVVAVGFLTVASIKSINYHEPDYSHNLEMASCDAEKINDIIYYKVKLSGEFKNNTEKDYNSVIINIKFSGINNKTSERAEYVSSVVKENVKAGEKIDLSKDVLRVGNKYGFVPTEVSEVTVLVNGESKPVEFLVQDDTNLILFGVGLVTALISSVLFIHFNTLRKKENIVK